MEAAKAVQIEQKNQEMLKKAHPDHQDFRLDILTVDLKEAQRAEIEKTKKLQMSQKLLPPRERIDLKDWEFPTEDLMVFGDDERE